MNTDPSTNSNDPQRGQRDEAAQWDVAFLERVMGYQDGTLTREQFAEFEAELRADEGKRRAFAELQMQSAGIHDALRRDAFASDGASAFASPENVLSRSESRPSVVLRFMRAWAWPVAAIGLAAAVLLSTDVLRRAATKLQPGQEVASPESNSQNSVKGFGQLARTSAVSWTDAALQIGDRLQAGRVKLADGTAEFDFDNGVRMVLTGPAEIELRDAMHAWLHSGQVVFRVPPAAIGFTVETADSSIVDLGTEFGVRAIGAADYDWDAAGRLGYSHGTELQVYEGEVIAEVKSDRVEASQQKRRLYGGQALQISSELEGGTQELPFVPERFRQPAKTINVTPAAIATDKAVKYDYDIVYVRAPRFGDERPGRWAEVFNPTNMDPGADLVLLHPDGSEEVLVEGGDGAVADPYVSFDGRWIYYAKFHDQTKRGAYSFPQGGADIFKIHVESRKIVQLTHQERTPNTGILSVEQAKNMPVFNTGPCPAPGGKIVFTSTRNLFEAPKGYTTGNFQLFVMDEDGANVEMIGHLNIGGALHPTILRDGRVMFSSYESEAMRDLRNWGLWYIYPDGTGWGPLVSSFQGADAYHFQTQLSDGNIVFEAYYNANNFGFGTFYQMPPGPKESYAAFGPADRNDPRNPPQEDPRRTRFSFTPYGMQSLTKFVSQFDSPAGLSDPADPKSRRVGKFTHPSGAPDNHLLTIWSAGSVNSNGSYKKDWLPWPDTGIYLIKDGAAIDEPGQMLVIKNDPKYNEQWPRAVVPYQRTYGVAEPDRHVSPRNDGTASPHLPAGSPFGLVGTSSFYKRESITGGIVPEGSVTAVAPKKGKLAGLQQFNYHRPGIDEWRNQGSDCGIYDNSEIHAMRLIAQEPTTQGKRKFWNWGAERYRILGEIPVRHFLPDGKQPLDPDGNPDTSFLARIPADTSFTMQMLDKDGMMLTMAQTWHQVRPGEIRHDCGGCHAHSQKPTSFELTFAAKPNYKVLDLAQQTPLLTAKQNDQSGQRWDEKDETGLRFEKAGVVNVEFHRDVLPIFQRSCSGCHSKDNPKPAANLVLDDLAMVATQVGGGMFRHPPGGKSPLSFAVLAGGHFERYGHSHLGKGWVMPQVSRYVRVYQSRRSLLAWKILGRRTDGWSNDDFPTATDPADPKTLQIAGQPVDLTKHENIQNADVDFTGSIMPPPEAVKAGKVKPLTDEDRRTIFRWIDLGCPIDFAEPSSQAASNNQASGWHTDEIRPTLTVTLPGVSERKPLSRILVGMHDAYTGLDMESFEVQADFAVNDMPAGENLASKFQPAGDGVWELKLPTPIDNLLRGRLTVSVRDRQGNVTRVERTFSVVK